MSANAFSPVGAAASAAITAASSTTALPGTGGETAYIYNTGAVYVAIKFGDSSVTAALTDTPIPPGTVVVLSIPNNCTHFACIGSAAGPSTVIVQRGAGL